MSRCLMFGLTLLLGLVAFAQNKVSGPVGVSAIKKSKKSVNENFQATLGARAGADVYSTPLEIDNGATQQIELNLRLKKQGLFFSNTEITLGTLSTPQSFFYAAPEAYIGYGYRAANVTVGRKLENLSFADQYFNLGLFQSYFSTDTINFQQQGLVSLSGHIQEDTYGMHLGFMPIFLPNQGPQTTAQDGKIITSSRWAQKPPEQFRFGDQNREIIYAISDYNLTDIVANSGAYASVYFGQGLTRQRPLMVASYAYKPLNAVILERDTFADIATFQGNVILTPVVVMHNVYTVDFNLDAGSFKSTFSFLGDRVENKEATDGRTIQNLAPLSVASVYMAYDLTSLIGQNAEIYGAMAQFNGGEITDTTSTGQAATFSFASSRTNWKRPLQFGARGDVVMINGRPLQTDISMTYDQEYRGSLLSANIRYAPTQDLRFSMGADVIGVEDESNVQNNYLSSNQANDRMTFGVGYVF